MDKLKAFESFVSVATRGSLTAAAKAEGVAPAIMGRRLDALEEHLGVKLLVRTTRRISLTHEGSAFLEDCQRLLSDVANAEASVSEGGVKATGHLRITAPAGFGRRHVAPLVPRFRAEHPDVTISLNLSDRVVDLAGEGFDCAVRVGDLPDSSLVSVRIADNRRLCVATPGYLKHHPAPRHPGELPSHDCLTLSSEASQTRGWAFRMPVEGGGTEVVHLKPGGPLDCSDGQVLHDWCLAGYGIAWRSTWEVEAEIAAGRLVEVLEEFAAPPNGIYVVFPQRKHMPLRVRLWIDFLKHHYAQPAFWRGMPAP
ncbi:transcriptional regulator [Acidovorax sp. CF316]|uniref:LysR family transcriptional regulator n=1 Tax=Acidovorax sp. CF316 TaxID=1144317 RepID=UPI00026BC822|nr:LysR family transcriptional regulator [Acidovorax sp. CF316]EJE49025.1 transcriptional regulator [Acidovorax sp. CF316]